MRIKNYLLTGLCALGVVLTGCSEDDSVGGGMEQGEATMTIKIVGSTTARATVTTEDSAIEDYKVYVFSNVSGAIEAEEEVQKESGSIRTKTTFTGLSTSSAKRIVVLANLGAGNYPEVNTYAAFSDESYKIDLGEQNPLTIQNGEYMMTGESVAVLTAGETATATVELNRIVAKVSLGSLTLSPEDGYDIEKFELLGVGVQRVTPEVTLAPLTSYYMTGAESENPFHYGGFVSANNEMIQKDYLADVLDLKDAQGNYKINEPYLLNNYFLVFPNDGQKDNSTLLTLKAKYNNEEMFFPIQVNYENRKEDEDDQQTDGAFVQNNKHYVLHITLKKIGDGTVDPEIPNGKADLDVVVEVKDWTMIIQNEIW